MARPQSPRYPHLDAQTSKLRSKEALFALVAGFFVLAFLFHARVGSSLLPATQPNDVLSTQTSQAGQEEKTDADLIALGLAPPVAATPGSPSLDITNAADSTSSGASADAATNSGSTDGNTAGSNNAGTGAASIITKPSELEESSHAADKPLAVVIETSIIPNLVPLMLHFSTVLGPNWGMVLFTLQETYIPPLSPAFQRHLESGRIQVKFLPTGTELGNSNQVSAFLTSPWIWEQLQSAKRVLLFQTDSVLCSKSESAVEDYFQYDYVGAPIAAKYGAGYNGGLSIRNPRTFLQVVRETDFKTSGVGWEDQFFYKELQRIGAPMPSEEEAKTFAVETIYYETPLGYHQPQRWQAENMQAIETWCPEVKMLIGKRAG